MYIFHGGSAGISSGSAPTAQSILTGSAAPASNTNFGHDLTTGDVNGDGHPDLIVGEQDTLKAYIFHGAATGVASVDLSSGGTASTTLTGAASSVFSHQVVAGDVNGDGFADLLVGAYLNPGAAYLFLGSSSGIASTSNNGASATFTDGTNFGQSLGIGDPNGDGYADLMLYRFWSPASNSLGRVYVLHGSASGIGSTSAPADTAAAILTGGVAFGDFGRDIAR